MVRRWTSGLRGMLLALAALPGCYVAAHAVMGGVAVAEATAPPSPRIHRDDFNSDAIEVATDGFFVIDAYGYNAVATSVHVTVEGGAEVPGTVKALTGNDTYVTWQANAPLPIGAHLSATVGSVEIPFTDSSTLVVVGEPTHLTEASIDFGAWVDYRHGTGDHYECTGTLDGFDQSLQVWTDHEDLSATYPRVTQQAGIQGMVVWEATIDQTPAQKNLNGPEFATIYGKASTPSFRMFVFPADTTEYCLPLTMRDLRTGDVVHTRACAMPQSGMPQADYDISDCNAPPTSELAPEWCQKHPESTLSVCHSDQQLDPGFFPEPTQPEPSNAAPAKRTSTACQFSPGPSQSGSFALASAAALIAFGRRRWQRVNALSSLGR